MKYLLIYFLTVFFIIGCQKQPKDTSIYIGGEIINPHTNFVLIMQKDKIIDSIFLTANNSFEKKITNLTAGLYYFKHGYEFQYLYLEPNDSIRLRLNTWDFDETIAFEGKGALKNELLIDLFLANEKEEKNFYSYFSLSEADFLLKIKETKNRHTTLLNDVFKTNTGFSSSFKHIAQAAIDYPIYRLKELYPFYHKKLVQSDSLFTITETYYRYRDSINLNDTILSEYYVYQNYVNTYLHSVAYQQNNSKLNDKKFHQILMQLIIDKIKNEKNKNRLLKNEVAHLFINYPHLLDTDILTVFYSHCSDSIEISKLKKVISEREKLQINKPFPSFMVASVTGETKNITHLIHNKNVALYFWSSNDVSDDYLRKRVRYLEKKYPQITFIGINNDAKTFEHSCLSKMENQYVLTDSSKGKEYVSNVFPRVILINSKGNVTTSFTSLTSHLIEKQLASI